MGLGRNVKWHYGHIRSSESCEIRPASIRELDAIQISYRRLSA